MREALREYLLKDTERRRRAEEFLVGAPEISEQEWQEFHKYSWDACPDGPHRGPEGPNEDLAQCWKCGSVSHCMRPEGETFGVHLDDCSLPIDHESYGESGGSGHPKAKKIRGYFGPETT